MTRTIKIERVGERYRLIAKEDDRHVETWWPFDTAAAARDCARSLAYGLRWKETWELVDDSLPSGISRIIYIWRVVPSGWHVRATEGGQSIATSGPHPTLAKADSYVPWLADRCHWHPDSFTVADGPPPMPDQNSDAAALALLIEIVDAWPSIGSDEDVNGGDVVEWLAPWLAKARKLVKAREG